MEVGVSPRAGLWRRRMGPQSRSGGLCLACKEGLAWPFGVSGWVATRATHLRLPQGRPPPKRRCTGGNWPRGPQKAESPPESTFLVAAERLATKVRGGGGGRWWDPKPRVDGPDRGDRVRPMAPLYLEFTQTLTPHFHWIAAAQRFSLWLVAKRTNLWPNCVFDTAEDYRVLHVVPKFVEALREMLPGTWRSCLHVFIFPIPQAVGDVDNAILDKGLGPIGDFPLLQDLWDSVVPEFYGDGLRHVNMEKGCEDGDRW